MVEDAIAHREFALTGEALHCSSFFFFTDRKVQEETQGRSKRCEVADEPVVVIKFRPVKAGNSVEGKTGMIRHIIAESHCVPKAVMVAKG